MTDQHPNGRHDPDPDAARLGAAWDDLVAGYPVETDGDDGLVSLARSMRAAATTVRGRPGFREQLRETIMRSPASAFPATGAIPAPFHNERPVPRRRVMPTADSVGRLGVRWLSVAATVALLLATVAGGYLSGVGRPGGGAPGTHLSAFDVGSPEAGTPAASGDYSCGAAVDFDTTTPYLPCPTAQEFLGLTEIRGAFAADDLAVTAVQMQSWSVVGGGAVTFLAPTTAVAGIAVDLVLDGAYSATFAGDATVTQAGQPNIAVPYTTVPTGTPVELAAGDFVSYEIGTKRLLVNPLGAAPLTFKSILIHDGDPSPSNLVEPGTTFQAKVDGDGLLPMAVGDYGPNGPSILLNYVFVIGGYPFPPARSAYDVVIGPVAGATDLGDQNGFVLWASRSAGKG